MEEFVQANKNTRLLAGKIAGQNLRERPEKKRVHFLSVAFSGFNYETKTITLTHSLGSPHFDTYLTFMQIVSGASGKSLPATRKFRTGAAALATQVFHDLLWLPVVLFLTHHMICYLPCCCGLQSVASSIFCRNALVEACEFGVFALHESWHNFHKVSTLESPTKRNES